MKTIQKPAQSLGKMSIVQQVTRLTINLRSKSTPENQIQAVIRDFWVASDEKRAHMLVKSL